MVNVLYIITYCFVSEGRFLINATIREVEFCNTGDDVVGGISPFNKNLIVIFVRLTLTLFGKSQLLDINVTSSY